MNEESVSSEATKICLEYIYRERASNFPFLLSGYWLIPVEALQLIPKSYRQTAISFQHIETVRLLEEKEIIKIGQLPKEGRFPFEIDYEKLENTFIPDSSKRNVWERHKNPLGEKFPPGLLNVIFNQVNAEKWIEKHTPIDKRQNDDFDLKNRNYRYENQELRIRQHDGTECTLDLSKAPTLRPVFETFYFLFINSKTHLFTPDELIKKYKELTGKDISWTIFMNRKSSICGKMMNTKECLRTRIKWEYDRKEKKHRFEILPLSDTLSDDRMKT